MLNVTHSLKEFLLAHFLIWQECLTDNSFCQIILIVYGILLVQSKAEEVSQGLYGKNILLVGKFWILEKQNQFQFLLYKLLKFEQCWWNKRVGSLQYVIQSTFKKKKLFYRNDGLWKDHRGKNSVRSFRVLLLWQVCYIDQEAEFETQPIFSFVYFLRFSVQYQTFWYVSCCICAVISWLKNL